MSSFDVDQCVRAMGRQAPEHIQTRNAGLAAALIGFTRQFSPEKPVDTVVTQKSVQVFHEGEPDIWIVLSGPAVLTHAFRPSFTPADTSGWSRWW